MLDKAAGPSLANVDTFCLFIGYGRSGHSAIGSIIDAHPNAVVSHELHAVARFFDGVSRDTLFQEILSLSQQQAHQGRASSKAGGGSYPHRIDGQLKSDDAIIQVIGDKKGAGTSRLFGRMGLEYIDRFKDYIGVPVKIIHVVRNPFDIVAAGKARGSSGFASGVPIVAAIRERQHGNDWLDLYYEDVIADPASLLSRIIEFLGLEIIPAHLQKCAAYLYESPRKRRFEIEWSAGEKSAVQSLIDRFDFLERYSWDS